MITKFCADINIDQPALAATGVLGGSGLLAAGLVHNTKKKKPVVNKQQVAEVGKFLGRLGTVGLAGYASNAYASRNEYPEWEKHHDAMVAAKEKAAVLHGDMYKPQSFFLGDHRHAMARKKLMDIMPPNEGGFVSLVGDENAFFPGKNITNSADLGVFAHELGHASSPLAKHVGHANPVNFLKWLERKGVLEEGYPGAIDDAKYINIDNISRGIFNKYRKFLPTISSMYAASSAYDKALGLKGSITTEILKALTAANALPVAYTLAEEAQASVRGVKALERAFGKEVADSASEGLKHAFGTYTAIPKQALITAPAGYALGAGVGSLVKALSKLK